MSNTPKTPAAPTQTRPRQPTYTMFRNKRRGMWSIACDGEAIISGLSKEEAQDTLKRYNLTARAAALEEPPTTIQETIPEAHQRYQRDRTEFFNEKAKVADPEREPAPRPLGVNGIPAVDIDPVSATVGPYQGINRAASSPAARPRWWTATDWYPLIQKANDAIFALEGKASPDAEDMLRHQFFQARIAIGKAENILRERLKKEGIE